MLIYIPEGYCKKYCINSQVKMSGKIFSLILLLGAVVAFAGCTEREPDSAVLLNRAVENGRVGKWQECEKNSLAVLKRDPGNIDALMLRSLASEHLGKMDVALAAARQAAENAPENFAAQ